MRSPHSGFRTSDTDWGTAANCGALCVALRPLPGGIPVGTPAPDAARQRPETRRTAPYSPHPGPTLASPAVAALRGSWAIAPGSAVAQ